MTFSEWCRQGAAAVWAAWAGTAYAAGSFELTGAELQGRGVLSLEGIAAAIPGLALTPAWNSSDTPILFMRGQGLSNPSQITRDGAVTIYQDGFPIVRAQASLFDLGELERVEVLEGPQTAAYGRNTTGGVINLVSKAPSGELGFQQSAEFGNRDRFRVFSSLDTARWHGLAVKMTLLASSIDGYVRNPEPHSHDFGQAKQKEGRLQLRWEGLAGLRAEYFVERSQLDSTPAYASNPALNGQLIYGFFPFFVPYKASSNGPTLTAYRPIDLPLSTSSNSAHGLTLAWEANESFAVHSLTGYRTLNANEQQDYAEAAGFAESTGDRYRHYQLSQDLKLSGSLFDRQVGYELGGTWLKEHGSHDAGFDLTTQGLAIDRLVSAAATSEAGYARLSWHPGFLSSRLSLSAAGRYTKDSKDARRWLSDNTQGALESGMRNHLGYRRVNPAFDAEYRWAEGVSTYVGASTGYQAGGALESAGIGEFAAAAFRPEHVITYDVGVQSSLLGGRLRTRADAFYSKDEDIQYAIPVGIVVDEVDYIQKATLRGVDLDVATTPLEDLSLSVRAAYLSWSIEEADVLAGTVLDPASGAGSPYRVGENVRELFALPYAPKYNLGAGVDYTLLHLDRRDISVHVDYAYRGGMFSTAAAGPAVPGRQLDSIPANGVLDARVSLIQETDWSHHVRITLWGNNVLNRKYYQLATGIGPGVTAFQTASGVTTPTGYTSREVAWAEPATFGLNATYQY